MSKIKETAASDAVFAYLLKQNRPYSATDLHQNMGKDIGKTGVTKALDSLVSEGRIKEKVYGKQKVYVIDQTQFPEVDETEIKTMDDKIAQLNGELQLKSDEVRKLESELKSFDNMLSTDCARSELSELYPEIEKLRTKLEKLKEGRVLISKEEKDSVYNNRSKFVKEWRKRKRISNDILNSILEGYPKTKKHLYEEIGIETDEDYNTRPPEL